MSVNSLVTKDYEENHALGAPENKANSNPIEANLGKTPMTSLGACLTQYDYEKQSQFADDQMPLILCVSSVYEN